MSILTHVKRPMLATVVAAVLTAGALAVPQQAVAQSTAVKPTNAVDLSVGTGRLVRLDGTMSDLFVANEAVADVQVRSANQIYIFGKTAGETTLYATNSAGRTVYSATVRVGNNIGSVGEMLSLTMPEAKIVATPMNGMVVLTGTVAAPADAAEAERLVQAFVGTTTQVISRLKTATPLQVMLKVKIAEVNRSLLKNFSVNLEATDPTSGFQFFGATGRDFLVDGDIVRPAGTNSFNLFGNLLGLNVASAIDANEDNGLATTLAEPTLVALSGETASFLAGGEFPIATTSGLNGTDIEFKEYGVSLSFTPVVLEGGRISMRVRPEVSELSTQGAITLNSVQIPALTTRRAETTVELGSGQSFMIGGLMQNNANNSVSKTPWLGDIPILGALFRSTAFRRNETELVIIVTPYLVKPVSANQLALPTDGYRFPDDAKRILLDQANAGRSGERQPMPSVAPPQTVAPGVGVIGNAEPVPVAPGVAPVQQAQRPVAPSVKPGFSF